MFFLQKWFAQFTSILERSLLWAWTYVSILQDKLEVIFKNPWLNRRQRRQFFKINFEFFCFSVKKSSIEGKVGNQVLSYDGILLYFNDDVTFEIDWCFKFNCVFLFLDNLQNLELFVIRVENVLVGFDIFELEVWVW